MPRFRISRRWVLRLFLGMAAVYLLTLTFLIIRQNHFVYLPQPGPSDPQVASALNFKRQEQHRPDGSIRVYWENAPDAAKQTILYFHGNGGGLWMHVPALNYLDAQHFHVIALEYPGYPGAAGTPSQSAIVADAKALSDMVSHTGKRPVIWGYSLGSGIAVQLAAMRPPAALVLEAPFTAVVDRASELFPFFPVRWMLHDQYRSREVIAQVHAPLLIIHGERDFIIPLRHGKALFALAQEPKTMRTYPAYGHLDLIKSQAYDDATAFIRQYAK